MEQKKSLLCRGKECVVKHLRKNRKIYIGGGITSGILAFAVLFVVFFGVSKADKVGGQEEQALLIFYKIDDIAHQREKIIEDLGYVMPQKENFHTIEESFHVAQSLHEKYMLARTEDVIIHLQDDFLKQIGYHDNAGDLQFQQLEESFDKIQ